MLCFYGIGFIVLYVIFFVVVLFMEFNVIIVDINWFIKGDLEKKLIGLYYFVNVRNLYFVRIKYLR